MFYLTIYLLWSKIWDKKYDPGAIQNLTLKEPSKHSHVIFLHHHKLTSYPIQGSNPREGNWVILDLPFNHWWSVRDLHSDLREVHWNFTFQFLRSLHINKSSFGTTELPLLPEFFNIFLMKFWTGTFLATARYWCTTAVIIMEASISVYYAKKTAQKWFLYINMHHTVTCLTLSIT